MDKTLNCEKDSLTASVKTEEIIITDKLKSVFISAGDADLGLFGWQ